MIIKLFFLLVLIWVLFTVFRVIAFKQSTYAKITGNGYFETIFDAGKYGEYLTYKKLQGYEKDGGKFLFNCYLPKDDGTTTEIDVMLIHSTGIFVVESKNYSGWIFGSEKARTWTQTLPKGKGRVQKEHFYNPIMQNNTHVKWLKKIVGNHVPIYSLIAFSERCTLKDITVEAPDIKVINRQYINGTVKHMGNHSIQALSRMDIERIYEMLYPYTQVTEYEKLQHIENINAARHGSAFKEIEKESLENDKAGEGTPEDKGTEEVKIEKEQNVAKEEQSSKHICPRCGAELVLRTAKKGEHAGEQFYGCSRFPKCRYKDTSSNLLS